MKDWKDIGQRIHPQTSSRLREFLVVGRLSPFLISRYLCNFSEKRRFECLTLSWQIRTSVMKELSLQL